VIMLPAQKNQKNLEVTLALNPVQVINLCATYSLVIDLVRSKYRN
jgi:hypothetical protein